MIVIKTLSSKSLWKTKSSKEVSKNLVKSLFELQFVHQGILVFEVKPLHWYPICLRLDSSVKLYPLKAYIISHNNSEL